MTAPALVPPPLGGGTRLDPAARRVVLRLLARLSEGSVVVEENGVRRHFGPGRAGEPRVVVRVRSPHAYLAVLRGSVGLARGYVDGLWDCDDVAGLVRILARNLGPLDRWRGALHPLVASARDSARLLRWNTRRRAGRRVRAHYDLGNDLFSVMLDQTMAYSCGVFPRPGASLEEASLEKLDLVCRKLGLLPSHHVVETGGGWGGFAIHAARTYGCRVTTTTLSPAQRDLAAERVARAGVSDRVRVLLMDYRDLRGRYDRLVSIEMVEAIGWQLYGSYMRSCARLLKPDGAMVIQAIVTSDRQYREWRSANGLANTVIFPGGTIPSVEALLEPARRHTDLRLLHLEDITRHYPPTLRAWRERFRDGLARLDRQRYGGRFARFWEFYLAYCEGAFAERRIRDVQMVLARPRHRVAGPGAPALSGAPGA